MNNVAINYVGKDNAARLAELMTLPVGTTIDITDENGERTDVDIEDEIVALGGTAREVEIKKRGADKAFTDNDIPVGERPKVEVIECIITNVTGVITRPANNAAGETSFKLVDYIKVDGTKGRILVNTAFLGANEGLNDQLIQRDAALELTVEHTIKGVTKYIETREKNVNYGKMLPHPNSGPSLRNVAGLGTKQAEVLEQQFAAKNKEIMAGAQVKQVEAFGESLAKYQNNPQMFEKMAGLFGQAVNAK